MVDDSRLGEELLVSRCRVDGDVGETGYVLGNLGTVAVGVLDGVLIEVADHGISRAVVLL